MLPSVVVQFPGLLSAPPSEMWGDPRAGHKGGQFGPEKQVDGPHGRSQGCTQGRTIWPRETGRQTTWKIPGLDTREDNLA